MNGYNGMMSYYPYGGPASRTIPPSSTQTSSNAIGSSMSRNIIYTNFSNPYALGSGVIPSSNMIPSSSMMPVPAVASMMTAPVVAPPQPPPLPPPPPRPSNLAAAAYDDDSVMPWEQQGFVPRTSSGKQKSPNQIRNELQKYIDSSSETQTAIIQRMGVNNNSFRKFMNPKTYKDQWSAVQNGTYWAAARLLEQDKYDKKQAKKAAGKKRTPLGNNNDSATFETTFASSSEPVKKKSRTEISLEAENLICKICWVQGVSANSPIYDSCPEVIKKTKDFLSKDGVTKAMFCRWLDDLNQNSLNPFLMSKKQDKCGSIAYRRAYIFFEKKRILDGEPKSKKRLKNEQEHPAGFSTKPKTGRGRRTWKFLPPAPYE